MEPRDIPFERCVLPIANDPLVMRWRLDFADRLSRNGHKERAHWFRRLCAFCEERQPLADAWGGGVDILKEVDVTRQPYPPQGIVRLWALYALRAARPDLRVVAVGDSLQVLGPV